MNTGRSDLLIGYAALGYRLHPLRERTKQPLLQDWPHKASADERTILHWLNRWPHCNWGIATDEGVSVLDIDPQALEAARPGAERQRELRATQCPLAQTPRGFHLFFKADWRCSAGKIAPGVDTRGAGGYATVAPSKTADGIYRWLRPLVAKERLPAPPGWLNDVVAAATRQMNRRSLMRNSRLLKRWNRAAQRAQEERMRVRWTALLFATRAPSHRRPRLQSRPCCRPALGSAIG